MGDNGPTNLQYEEWIPSYSVVNQTYFGETIKHQRLLKLMGDPQLDNMQRVTNFGALCHHKQGPPQLLPSGLRDLYRK